MAAWIVMKLSLRRPSPQAVRDFLTAQSNLSFTYTAVGATLTIPPAGYVVDHTRVKLGRGEEVYSTARSALEHWEQFRLGWIEAYPSETPIRAGEVVALIARAKGLWFLNACRIIYVIDDTGPIRRFGFAYGTLPQHAGTGEERFLVEWDRATGDAWYDILAFSRPNGWLSRVGYRYMRRSQKRFGQESAAAMKSAVKNAGGD
jgi:uncharacterized protein (UPF0548 family)